GKSDDTSECIVWSDIDVRIPGELLRGTVDDHDHDDVLDWRQQRVWSVHEDIDVLAVPGDEGTGGDLGDAVERELRNSARRADNWSVLHVHAGGARNGSDDKRNGDVGVCGRRIEPGE